MANYDKLFVLKFIADRFGALWITGQDCYTTVILMVGLWVRCGLGHINLC